jgi:hypothetical protein
MTIEKASTSSTESLPASNMKDFQQVVKRHFAVEHRRQESVVFAPSMIWRHGQTAWRRTVLFAMFYDEFLRNMEMRGTWQSFNESHCWHVCIVESHAICICHKLLKFVQLVFETRQKPSNNCHCNCRLFVDFANARRARACLDRIVREKDMLTRPLRASSSVHSWETVTWPVRRAVCQVHENAETC